MADFYAIYNIRLKVNNCQSQNEVKRLKFHFLFLPTSSIFLLLQITYKLKALSLGLSFSLVTRTPGTQKSRGCPLYFVHGDAYGIRTRECMRERHVS